MTKLKCDKNIVLVNLYSGLIGGVFILPVIVMFFQNQLGLTFGEFMFTQAVFAAGMFVLEVPTGYIGDLFKRKIVLAISSFFMVLGWLYYWFVADDLAGAIIAELLLAVGACFYSGTVNAILYDHLVDKGWIDEARQQEGRRFGITLYMVGFASIVGAWLYDHNPMLPVIVTLVTKALGIAAALLMDEPQQHKEPVRKNPLHDMAETMRYALHGHKEVAFLIFAGALIFSSTKISLWVQQPYYEAANIPVATFGMLMAASFFVSGIIGQWGHHLDGKLNNRQALFVLFLLQALAAAGAAFLLGPQYVFAGVPVLLLGHLVYGLGYPRFQTAVNNLVESSRRGTILSTSSLMIQLAAIPLMWLFGIINDHGSLKLALLAQAGLALFIGVPLILGSMRKRKA
ncbi:MAG: MFS transporter [Alphaproteobacteria bacterium]|nr:MFS transporter [Alphaproteobacteria bacterium]